MKNPDFECMRPYPGALLRLMRREYSLLWCSVAGEAGQKKSLSSQTSVEWWGHCPAQSFVHSVG